MFNKGFVFGKFYPLHNGHLAMIEFALGHCQHLSILVCCSNTERIPSAIRASWLSASLGDNPRVQIIELPYDETQLPNTSVSDKAVSSTWARVFKECVPDAELVITSEPYGDYVAEAMGIAHRWFDHERNVQPISASRIRHDMRGHWNFLPEPVRLYFQRSISICGTESTGKTCLANHLAQVFSAGVVSEVGRELIADSSHFSLDDLYRVAEGHAQAIANTQKNSSQLLILDTDVYITQSYARFAFDRQLELNTDIYSLNRTDLRLYLNAEAPYIQDGTRLPEHDRNRLDYYHRQTLDLFRQDYREITGSHWEERTRQAEAEVLQLLNFVW